MPIILYQPQIPPNTGNIVRTCAVIGASLILVRPLGFSLASRHLKRAGLDYWEGVSVNVIDDLESFLQTTQDRFFFFSSKASQNYSDVSYQINDHLIFGSETKGLPSHFWEKWPDRFVTIPQKPGVRCLNLASAVAVGAYEKWRQLDFIGIDSRDRQAQSIGQA